MKIDMVVFVRLMWIAVFWIILGSDELSWFTAAFEPYDFSVKLAAVGLLTFGIEWCLTCVAEIIAYVSYGLIRLIERITE